MNSREGVCAVFDANIEVAGYRGDAEIVLIAVVGDRRTIYTDMWSDEKAAIIERTHNCEILALSSFDPARPYVGHNIPQQFPANDVFDLMAEAQKVSAEVLQNEGKRYALSDLVRTNLPIHSIGAHAFLTIVDYTRSFSLFRSGRERDMAREVLNTADVCRRLFNTVVKKKRLRFLNPQTGKKAHADVHWMIQEEE